LRKQCAVIGRGGMPFDGAYPVREQAVPRCDDGLEFRAGRFACVEPAINQALTPWAAAPRPVIAAALEGAAAPVRSAYYGRRGRERGLGGGQRGRFTCASSVKMLSNSSLRSMTGGGQRGIFLISAGPLTSCGEEEFGALRMFGRRL
jgi:hypothetical protein